MADDIRKSISINFNVIDSAVKKLDDAIGKLDNVVKAIDSFSGKMAGAEKSITAVVTPLQELGKINVPNIQKISKGLKELAEMGTPPKLDDFVTELKKLSGLSAPNLISVANGLKELVGIKNISAQNTKITSLGTALTNLDGITLPNLKNIIDSVEKLVNIKNVGAQNAKIVSLAQALRTLDGITLPNLKDIAIGVEKLANIKTIRTVNQRIESLSKSLKGLEGIVIPDFTSFSTFLSRISNVKPTSLKQLREDIELLAQKFERLSKNDRIVTALAQIGAAAEATRRQMGNLQQSTESSSGAFQQFGDKIKRYIPYRIIADSVMFAKQAMTAGIDTIIEYDQGLKNLQAITRATDGEIKLFGDRIQQVASDTKFSVTEIADAMVILGQAGLSSSEVIQTIGPVADLATGTLTSLATTVDLVTTSMRVFDIEAGKAGHIADVFANAVNGSKLTIDKLRVSLNYVGPIANDAGLKFEEVTASLMSLANSGLRASTIGTSMRKMLQELIDPSDKFLDAMHQSGFVLKDFNIRVFGMTNVLEKLRRVLYDSETGFINVGKASEFFGARAVSGVTALLDKSRDGVLIFEEMLQKTNEAGSAAEMARIQLEGLATGYKNLKDRIGVLATELGNVGLTDVMRDFLELSKNTVSAIISFIQNNRELIKTFLQVTATVTTIVGTLVILRNAFFSLSAVQFAYGLQTAGLVTGMETFSVILGVVIDQVIALTVAMFTNPWGLALISIAAATAAIMAFGRASETSTRSLEEQIKIVSDLRDEYTNTTSELENLSKRLQAAMDPKSGLTLESREKERKDIVSELIRLHPNYIETILSAGESYDLLEQAIKKVNDLERERLFRETAGEVSNLIDSVKKGGIQLQELQNQLNNAASGFGFKSKEEKEKRIAELNDLIKKTRQTIDGGIAGIVLSIKKYEGQFTINDWIKILGADKAKEVFTLLNDIEKRAAQRRRQLDFSSTGIDAPKDLVRKAEEVSNDRLAIYKSELIKFDKLRSLDVKNKDYWEQRSLQATIQYHDEELAYRQSVVDAILDYEKKNPTESDPESKDRAIKKLRAAEQERLNTLKRGMDSAADSAVSANDKIEDVERQLKDVTGKYQLSKEQAVEQYTNRRVDLEERAALSIESLEDQLANKISQINERKNDKLEALDNKRLQNVEKNRNALLKSQESISDKLSSINQRFLSDTEVQADNLIRANQKLEQALENTKRANETGSSKALENVEQLLNQAESLYAALNNPVDASKGLLNVKQAYAQVYSVKEKLDQEEYKRKQELVNTEAERDTLVAQMLHDDKLKKIHTQLAIALENVDTAYNTEKEAEELRYNTRIKNLKEELRIRVAALNAALEEAKILGEKVGNIGYTERDFFPDKTPAEILEESQKTFQNEEFKKKLLESANYSRIAAAGLEELQNKHRELKAELDQKVGTLVDAKDAETIKIISAELDDIIATIIAADQTVRDRNFWDYFIAGAKKATDSFTDINVMAMNMGDTVISGIASGIDDLVTSTDNWRETFRKTALSIVQDLNKMILKMLIMKALYAALGWLETKIGPTSGSTFTGDISGGGFGAQTAASGGPILGSSPSPIADNIPIWATAGEWMMPVKAVEHYGTSFMEAIRSLRFPKNGFALGGLIPKHRGMIGYAAGGQISAAGGIGVELNFFLNKDGSTEKTSSSNMGPGGSNIQRFAEEIERLVERKILDEKRTGGLLDF